MMPARYKGMGWRIWTIDKHQIRAESINGRVRWLLSFGQHRISRDLAKNIIKGNEMILASIF